MNNLVKKNIVYSLSTNYDLPYDSKNDTSLKANQIIYTSINNNFQKLVDNDLYTEKRLLDRYNYPIGPKSFSEARMSSSSEGYKMWKGLDSENLSILHKYENSLSSSTYKIGEPDAKINFFLDFGEYVAGTQSGLYRTRDGLDWTNQKSGVLSDIEIISYYNDEEKGVLIIGTNNGLYQLSNYEMLGDAQEYLEFVRKDEDDFLDEKRINSINVLKTYGEIHIGTDDGVYVGTHFDEPNRQDKFTEKQHYIVQKKIVDTKELSSGTILQISEVSGLYERLEKYGFLNLEEKRNSNAYKKIKYSYALTNRGLYEIKENNLEHVKAYGQTTIFDILNTSDGKFIVSTKTGLYVNGKKFNEDINDIDILHQYKDMLVFSRGDELYYVQLDKMSSKEEMVQWTKKVDSINSIINSIEYHDAQLYVATEDGLSIFDSKSGYILDVKKKPYYITGGSTTINERVNYINKISQDKTVIGTLSGMYILDSTNFLQKVDLGEDVDVKKIIYKNSLCFVSTSSKIIILNAVGIKNEFSFSDVSEIIRDIGILGNGILITTNKNLYRYDIGDEKIEEGTKSKAFDDTIENLIGTQVIGDTAYLVSRDKIYKLGITSKYLVKSVGNVKENTSAYKRYSNASENQSITYFQTDSGLVYAEYGPEGSTKQIDKRVASTSGAKCIDFQMRINTNKMYVGTSNGLEYTNAYFEEDKDNLQGLLISTDEMQTVQQMQGKDINGMVCVKDSINDETELSDQTLMIVGTSDDGIWYNKTDFKNVPQQYPVKISESFLMDRIQEKAPGSDHTAYSDYILIGRDSNDIYTVSYDVDDRDYLISSVHSPSEINNMYQAYQVHTKENTYVDQTGEEITTIITVIRNSLIVTTKNGLYAGSTQEAFLSSSNNYRIISSLMLANGTSGSNIRLWTASDSTNNYLLDDKGHFLYNTTDQLLSTFIPTSKGGKSFHKNSDLEVSAVLDICTPSQNVMILSRPDGLYKYSDIRSDVTKEEQPDLKNSGIKNAKWLCKIDSSNILAICDNSSDKYACVIETSECKQVTGKRQQISGTITNVSDRNKTVIIYTNTRTAYVFDKVTKMFSTETLPYSDILNHFTRTNGTTIYTDKNKFYFMGLNENYDYFRLQYDSLNFTNVYGISKNSRGQFYVVADGNVYKFSEDFINKKPQQINIESPVDHETIGVFVDNGDCVYYCTYGDEMLHFIKYSPEDEYIDTVSVEYQMSSGFNGFYVQGNSIYIIDSNGNNRVDFQNLVKKDEEKDVSEKYGNVNDSTYYDNNVIMATDSGIVEYDEQTKLLNYFNDGKLDKIKITRLYNSGEEYAAESTTGLSTFTSSSSFKEKEYLKGKEVFAYLNSENIGLNDGMYQTITVTTSDISQLKSLDYHVTKMFQSKGMLFGVIDNKLNTFSQHKPKPYTTVIDGVAINVSDVFFMSGYNIYVYQGRAYKDGKLIENFDGYPSYMLEKGIYKWFISEEKIYLYDDLGTVILYEHINNDSFKDISLGKSINIDGRMILIPTNDGLKRYDYNQNILENITEGRISFLKEDYSERDEFTEQINNRYVFGVGNKVYSLYKDEIYNDSKIVSELAKYPSETITDILFKNKYEIIYGGISGIYKTFYSYYVEDDFHCGEISDIVNAIKTSYDDIISNHIEEYHNISSTITILNEKMPSDCSDISGIRESENIRNIYDNISFEDYNRYIKAKSIHMNELSSFDQQDIEDITYIRMQMLNGKMSDIYINIPNTNTYYIPHTIGVPNCGHGYSPIYRKNCNLSVDGDMYKNSTYVDITLDNSFFNIESIVHYEVNGTSLPIKIYKDDTQKYPDGDRFSALILPSMIYGKNCTVNENYVNIRIMCLGTDEQCIHLTVINKR